MRGINVSVMREFAVVIEKGEDGYYVASVPALPGCHTQAKTIPQLMKRIKEAAELCIECGVGADAMKLVGLRKIAVGGHARPAPC